MSRDPIRRRYRRFFGADPQRDVDDELDFHFAMREEEFRRAGMTADDAREATVRRFGDVDRVREECSALGRRRAARQNRASWLDALRQDVRFALRSIAVNRGFSLMVVLTLALGIGATTAVFSVAYGVLLRPLPYRDADALVRLWSRNAERGLEFFSVSPADYETWRARNRVFTAMGRYERQREAAVVRRAEPQAIEVAAVGPEVFPLLGAGALRGRTLLPEDARQDAAPVAVIAHDLWAARFGSDPSLLGGDLTIDGRRHTVVGVMAPRFFLPGNSAQIWTPLSPANDPDHGNRYLRVLGRLAPGVSLEGARLQMDAIAAALAKEFPGTNSLWSVNIRSVPEMIVGTQFRRALLVLLGVVGFVLLIACANSANLQLARGAARRREIAVRAALGATRSRITAQLLVESVVLGLVAGLTGLGLARAGVDLLRKVGEETVPRLADVRIDGPVLAFTVVVSLATGALFGLLPALRASRADIGEALKAGGRGQGHGAMGGGLRAGLVVIEVSLSLVLLVGAGLLMRSFVRLQDVDVGFDPAGVAAIRVGLPEASYAEAERRGAFYASLLERVRQIPGVRDAAAVSSAPFAGPNTSNAFARQDRPAAGSGQAPDADYRVITPGYFRTLGIRLLRGRDFSDLDRQSAPATVLISETTARRHWPDEDPIGGRIRVGDVEKGPTFTIVGIVADVRYQSRETPDVRPMLYFSALARPPRTLTFLVRTGGGPVPAAALRRTITSLDPALPPPAVEDMERLLGMAISTPRFALTLFSVFAGAALLLAVVGLYGVMSYLVRQRTHEFGVRSALGASPRALLSAVIGGALRLTLAGVVLGLLGAWLLTRSMASLLFGVSATDPVTFGAIALLLTGVGVVASVLPARRAARVDPLVALRGGS